MNRINNINCMLGNKTFYGLRLSKKSNRLSPEKEKTDKKISRNHIKSIVKLPSVKNTIPLDIKNYQVGDLIGEGAFSKVYTAKRIVDGHKCVIKMIQKSRLNTDQRKRAFKRELEALSLPKHRNLVHSIDQFETSDTIAIVMEMFSHKSLAEFIKEHRPLDNSSLQKITKQVCEGLMHLHSHGVSHRDIKPENILINEDQELKIIDFGFATTLELDEVVVAGTPQYMAPELVSRKNYDPLKADVWAFGVMLYWIALGYFPQDADPKKKKTTVNGIMMGKKWQDYTLNFPVDMNPGLEYLLRKMLQTDPRERIELGKIMEDTWIKPKLFRDEIQRLRQSKNIQTPITAT